MRGFSLIELLIALAIAGVLAAIALPGYSQVMHRALRQDARLALLRTQHLQESYFASHLKYSSDLLPRSDRGYYLLELRTSVDGMTYTALARADPAGRQAGDSHCTQLAIDETGRRSSAGSDNYWRDDDPWRCWG